MALLLEVPGEYGERAERRCSRCGEMKAVNGFPMKNKKTGLRRVWCRDCCRAYGREHYRRNRPMYLSKNERRRRTVRPVVRGRIDAYLRDHPCIDCGCNDITVLEFDHRDPSQKDDDVGELARSAEWPRVLREIEKCDVRCANCHRRRTGEQFNWAKARGVIIDPDVVRPGMAGRYRPLDSPRQELLFSVEPHGLRRCSRCGELRSLPDFSYRNMRAGERAYYCRPCRVAYRRAHYETNRSDYIRRAMTEVQLKKEDVLLKMFEYLGRHPCVDCGETDLGVLEFDHVDRSTKSMNIASMIGSRNWRSIMSEVQKCEVRCANCHRRRTARQQGWRVRLAERRGRYGRIVLRAGVAQFGRALPPQGRSRRFKSGLPLSKQATPR